MKSKQGIISEYVRGKVLDVGYAQEPNPFLTDAFGVDIVLNPQPNYHEVKQENLNTQSIPYDDNFFHTVVIGCTLAHVYNPFSLLCEANRVLVDGGLLIVTSPNPHYYWEVALNIFYHFFKYRVGRAKLDEHFYSFSRFDMRTILNRAGFAVELERGFQFAIVKTPFRFNVPAPLAYEIVYIATKVAAPKHYITTSTSNAAPLFKLEV